MLQARNDVDKIKNVLAVAECPDGITPATFEVLESLTSADGGQSM